MKASFRFSQIFLLCLVFILAACSTTRRLQDDQYLLVKNKIKFINPSKNVSESDLQDLIQQKPNTKFLGIFPIKLWINNIWIKSGEPPVVLDKSLINESKAQMERYLDNVGYFNSNITDTIKIKHKKAKKVTYLVKLGVPYRIRDISDNISDDSIKEIIHNHRNNSLIDTNDIYNSYELDKERERIAKLLNNNGYYDFSKDYIYFKVDSSLNSHQLDITTFVKNVTVAPAEPGKPPVMRKHKVYYVNDIYILPNFLSFQPDSVRSDTVKEVYEDKRNHTSNVYNFVFKPPLKIKPGVITQSVFIRENHKYNATDAQQSFKKLNELRLFKYVNINFTQSNKRPDLDSNRNYLDCTIQLTRNPVNSYSIEMQGTNSGGDLGLGGYLVYQNKNIFRGGEIFNIRLKGALEAQNGGITSSETANRKILFFNTYEMGVEGNLDIPKFLAPINQSLFSRYFRPKTTINAGWNLQDRLEYRRIITNVTFGYEWLETQNKTHILYPADINLVKVKTTPEFDSILSKESSRFRDQYTDHLIVGMKYSYIFNNQEINKIKNFFYFRVNFEASGNLLHLILNTTGAQKNQSGYQTLFGIRYSQYVKTSLDFRYYIPIKKNHWFALRYYMGVAIPYSNSIDIPFEKGFYGGGANDLRAWQLRYLGPGSYVKPASSSDIERVGDVTLEGNFEYRFPLYKVVKGALFYDVGNIWLLSGNETFPGGKFTFSNFPNELAMDGGIGIRLDFSYFIFRVDIAQRIKDPALPAGKRWVVGNSSSWFDPVFNLGIGYPF